MKKNGTELEENHKTPNKKKSIIRYQIETYYNIKINIDKFSKNAINKNINKNKHGYKNQEQQIVTKIVPK